MSEVRFWDDFKVGESWESTGRTVTETDVVHFAMMSGDWMPGHTDRESAKSLPYGERIAHGLLGVAIASGLFIRTECCRLMAPNVLALLGLDWKFVDVIKINDTVHLRITVVEVRETSRPERGVLTLERELINQSGVVVQRGRTPILVKRRPAAEQ
jgi:acyl dehydratase